VIDKLRSLRIDPNPPEEWISLSVDREVLKKSWCFIRPLCELWREFCSRCTEVSGSLEANGTKKLIEIVYDLLIELNTGTLFSFPADWRRQIFKAGPRPRLLRSGSGTNGTLFGFRWVSVSAEACNGSEFEDEDEFEDD